ncbi:MAG: GNAT family N-acetyltransferase [Bryobacteraceae bacterium]|nr:GNAT family N-acetyltransferase [Bryobacteraceae bacterium]
MSDNLRLRLAQAEDIPALTELVERSARALQKGDYTQRQIDGALGTVYGIDPRLIADRTYYMVETPEPAIAVACGGWSRRRTAFGSGNSPVKDDALLDPATDPARIRGFFIHPSFARQGLGTTILQACESAALAAGFHRFELTATLTGVALYARHGYQPVLPYALDLPNGETLPVLRMAKQAPAAAAAP